MRRDPNPQWSVVASGVAYWAGASLTFVVAWSAVLAAWFRRTRRGGRRRVQVLLSVLRGEWSG